MKAYLFIGGNKDGLHVLVPPDLDKVEPPADVTGSETYIRDALSVGDVFIAIYRHESLSSEQALDRLLEFYKAWAARRSDFVR